MASKRPSTSTLGSGKPSRRKSTKTTGKGSIHRTVKAGRLAVSKPRPSGAEAKTSRRASGVTSVHALDITPQLEQIGVSATVLKRLPDISSTRGVTQVKVVSLADDRAGAVVGKKEVSLRYLDGRILISFPGDDADLSSQGEATPASVDRARAAVGGAGLDESLWGPAPTNIDIQEASLQTKDRAFAARREVLDQSVTRARAAQWLSVSEPTISDRIADRSLVAIKDGREWRLPMWQFDPDTERGFLPGLDLVQGAFPGNAVSLSMWVLTDNPTLGVPPVAALSEGRVEEVLGVIRTLRAST